jgi:chromosome segregation ATPase
MHGYCQYDMFTPLIRCDILDESKHNDAAARSNTAAANNSSTTSALADCVTAPDAECLSLVKSKLLRGWLLAANRSTAMSLTGSHNVVTVSGEVCFADGEVAIKSTTSTSTVFAITTQQKHAATLTATTAQPTQQQQQQQHVDDNTAQQQQQQYQQATRLRQLERQCAKLISEIDELVMFQARTSESIDDWSAAVQQSTTRLQSLQSDAATLVAAITARTKDAQLMTQVAEQRKQQQRKATSTAAVDTEPLLQKNRSEQQRLKSRLKSLNTRTQGQATAKKMAEQAVVKAVQSAERVNSKATEAQEAAVLAKQAVKACAKSKRAVEKAAESSRAALDSINDKLYAAAAKLQHAKAKCKAAATKQSDLTEQHQQCSAQLPADDLATAIAERCANEHNFMQNAAAASATKKRQERAVDTLEQAVNADAIEADCSLAVEYKRLCKEATAAKAHQTELKAKRDALAQEQHRKLTAALEQVCYTCLAHYQ